MPSQNFTPLAWQIPAWRDKKQIMLLTGSAGGGKSRLAAEKVHAFLLKYPGATGLIARKTRESLKNSVIAFMRHVVMGYDNPHILYKPSEYRFEYNNGSMMVWGGFKDQAQREQIRSIGKDGSLDIAWLEEGTAFTEQDFNELLPRMRGKAADWTQIILTTNPDNPYHWIYQRLITGGEASVFLSNYKDNIYNPKSYGTILAHLTGIQKLRLVEGIWSQSEGIIFDEWSAAAHVCDYFEIPSDWRRFRVVDFGFVNPAVCQWWALSHDNRAYLYKEFYHTRYLTTAFADIINRESEGQQFEATIADHDAAERAILMSKGIPTWAAKKDVNLGIQLVKDRLRLAEDGTPMLQVMRGIQVEEDMRLRENYHPIGLEQEIVGYVWDTNQHFDVPLKQKDHACDALRYFVMHIDKPMGVDIMALNGLYTNSKGVTGW